MLALARDLGIAHTAPLASKIREGELPSVQASPKSGFELADAVSYDECFHHAERAAVAPIDFSPDSPAVVAIGRLAGRLIRGGRAA